MTPHNIGPASDPKPVSMAASIQPMPSPYAAAPDPVAALREEVAGVLARHRFLDRNMADETGCRGCRWTTPLRGTRGRNAHEKHLTDALLAHLAPLVEARERVEALADKWQAMTPIMLCDVVQLRAANALTPTEERP